jgi:zinc and cadmium transporter
MGILSNIILANFLISLGSLLGVFSLTISGKKLNRILLLLVALSAGALMGGALFHLLPEALQALPAESVFGAFFIAFAIFFLVEKLLHWRHCHKQVCQHHAFGQLNLLGDAIHNFIDGLIIAGAFLVDINLGWATTLAVALHEIPQEIGDFGVLLYSGFTKRKALIVNLFVGLTAIAGGVAGYFLSFQLHNLVNYLLPFAAGGFVYIAASDLIPEIRKETNAVKSFSSFGIFLLGVALMLLLRD